MRDVRKTLDGLREIVMKGALRFLLDYFGFVFLLMLLFVYVSDGTFSDSALIWISFIMAGPPAIWIRNKQKGDDVKE